MCEKWEMSDEAALNILKRDNVYNKTSINFDYALERAISALEEKMKVKDRCCLNCKDAGYCDIHRNYSIDYCSYWQKRSM